MTNPKSVRITQIDGALPNVALMRLSHWHKAQGHTVNVTRQIERDLFEQESYDFVYGSCIFSFSRDRLDRFLRQWPNAIVGGTGTAGGATIEQLLATMNSMIMKDTTNSMLPSDSRSAAAVKNANFALYRRKRERIGLLAALRKYGAAIPTQNIFICLTTISLA